MNILVIFWSDKIKFNLLCYDTKYCHFVCPTYYDFVIWFEYVMRLNSTLREKACIQNLKTEVKLYRTGCWINILVGPRPQILPDNWTFISTGGGKRIMPTILHPDLLVHSSKFKIYRFLDYRTANAKINQLRSVGLSNVFVNRKFLEQ